MGLKFETRHNILWSLTSFGTCFINIAYKPHAPYQLPASRIKMKSYTSLLHFTTNEATQSNPPATRTNCLQILAASTRSRPPPHACTDAPWMHRGREREGGGGEGRRMLDRCWSCGGGSGGCAYLQLICQPVLNRPGQKQKRHYWQTSSQGPCTENM